MIVKHLIIVVVKLVLLSAAFYIFITSHIQPSDATKDTIFGDSLNISTITSSANTTNKTTQNLAMSNIVHSFEESFAKLVNDTRSLSLSYQNEIGKWQLHQHDNTSMISITDDYLPKFQNVFERAKELKPPSEGYKRALDLFAKSIQSEMASHIHFRNFLATSNLKEDEISIQLLSDAFKYESESFDAFKAAASQ
ncbi:MAG: hypothetical protein M3250_08555 [Thermoproteota archaeon]|nr:hypothetical protein [Thermoproteota archaeon]